MLTYFRNWPEGLFILLVMLAPLGVAYLLRPESVLGFFGIMGLGMVVGFVVWLACIWLACSVFDRKERSSRR
jgi:hypothetical protein